MQAATKNPPRQAGLLHRKEKSCTVGKINQLKGESGSDIAHPGVLEFAVRRGDGELEQMPVSAKPRLTNVPKQGHGPI